MAQAPMNGNVGTIPFSQRGSNLFEKEYYWDGYRWVRYGMTMPAPGKTSGSGLSIVPSYARGDAQKAASQLAASVDEGSFLLDETTGAIYQSKNGVAIPIGYMAPDASSTPSVSAPAQTLYAKLDTTGKVVGVEWKPATGAEGKRGQPGPKGDKGDKGDRGSTGAQGKIGRTGPQGPRGTALSVKASVKEEKDLPTNAPIDEMHLVTSNGTFWVFVGLNEVGEKDVNANGWLKLGVIQGPEGAMGEPGQDGRDGRDGYDGRDGVDGPKGDTGDRGQSPYEEWRDNQAAMSLPAGFGDWLEAIQGDPGPVPEMLIGNVKTIDYADYEDGTRSPEVVIASGDGSQAFPFELGFTLVTGPEGPVGPEGPQGDKGDYSNITIDPVVDTLPPQTDATVTVTAAGPGNSDVIVKFAIPQGEKGDQGDRGPQGDAGVNGLDGRDGAPGLDGLEGADGADGTDGVDGVDGKDGVSLYITTITGNIPNPLPVAAPNPLGEVRVYDNGSIVWDGAKWVTGPNLRGPQGVKGDTGLFTIKSGKGKPVAATTTAVPNTLYVDTDTGEVWEVKSTNIGAGTSNLWVSTSVNLKDLIGLAPTAENSIYYSVKDGTGTPQKYKLAELTAGTAGQVLRADANRKPEWANPDTLPTPTAEGQLLIAKTSGSNIVWEPLAPAPAIASGGTEEYVLTFTSTGYGWKRISMGGI
jgi:hypothetical protein